MKKCKCSACKNPKKKLPHPVETCECKICRNIRCAEDLEIYNNVYNPPRHLDVINDEGIFVPLTPSGSDKHGNQETTSDAKTVEFRGNNFEDFKICPKCLQYFIKNSQPIEYATIEKEGMCQRCRPIVYWEVYEQYPTDGGDCFRIIVIREDEFSAQKVVEVLERTDINWSCYGYRRVEVERTKPIIDSLWTRFNNWLNSPSPV